PPSPARPHEPFPVPLILEPHFRCAISLNSGISVVSRSGVLFLVSTLAFAGRPAPSNPAERTVPAGDTGRSQQIPAPVPSRRILRLIARQQQVELRVAQHTLAVAPAVRGEDAVGALEEDLHGGAVA